MQLRSRLFDKPVFFHKVAYRPLSLAGEFPRYVPAAEYRGTLDIINGIGRCSVELLEGDLPPGYKLYVDNFEKKVVLTWPPYSPPRPTEEGILNWNFELGTLAGWNDLRGNSWSVYVYDRNTPGAKDNPYLPPDGNFAAKMEGVGRGEHVLESDKYAVSPGLPISARSLWYQGASNKDNNNLWTAIQFYTPGGVPLVGGEVRGDRIHDRTNKRRHWSTVNTTVPAGAGWATVKLIAQRRNSRNRLINVDDVETTGFSYIDETGWAGDTDFPLKLRVRDSAGRSADWEGVIRAGAGLRWYTVDSQSVGGGNTTVTIYMSTLGLPGTWEVVRTFTFPTGVNNGHALFFGDALLLSLGDHVVRLQGPDITNSPAEVVVGMSPSELGDVSRASLFEDLPKYGAFCQNTTSGFVLVTNDGGRTFTRFNSSRVYKFVHVGENMWYRYQYGSTRRWHYAPVEDFLTVAPSSWASLSGGSYNTGNQPWPVTDGEHIYVTQSGLEPGNLRKYTPFGSNVVQNNNWDTTDTTSMEMWKDGVLLRVDGTNEANDIRWSDDYGATFTTVVGPSRPGTGRDGFLRRHENTFAWFTGGPVTNGRVRGYHFSGIGSVPHIVLPAVDRQLGVCLGALSIRSWEVGGSD